MIQVAQTRHVNLLKSFCIRKQIQSSAIFQCDFCPIISLSLRRMLVVGQILLHLTLRYFPPNTIAFMKISANKLKRQEFIQVFQPKLTNMLKSWKFHTITDHMTSLGNKCKFPNHGQSRGKNGMFQSTIDNCYCSRKMSTLRTNDMWIYPSRFDRQHLFKVIYGR